MSNPTPAAVPEPQRPPRAVRLPNALRLYFVLLLLQLVLFSILRFILIARTYLPELAPKPELVRAMAVGLRFDLATAAVIALALVLLSYLPPLNPARNPRSRNRFLGLVSLFFFGIIFTLLAELEFFREFQTRYNQLALRYLIHPKTVGGMIWYDYPVIRYLLVVFVLTLLFYFALRFALRRTLNIAPALQDGPHPPSLNLTQELIREITAFTLIIIVSVFCIRGGFQPEPLSWGSAFRGPNEYANQMSGNGLYTLAGAARDMASRGRAASSWKAKLPSLEARSLARSLVVAPTETLLDPDHRTMLRTGSPGSSLHLRRADGKPVNVVVVMMESFSGRYVGALGAKRSFSPNFDALAKDGILFDRILSAGSHTHQGIFATQLGFPNLPGYESLMESTSGNQDFLSLARIFESLNYQTLFLYNGDLAWDNMYGFFQKQGINTFIAGDKMLADAKYPDPVWGVSDTDLFTRANKEFQAASERGPFFAAVMTLSNHSPYLVPPIAPNRSDLDDLDGKTRERMLAFQYADYALGQFITEAKTLPYFKDTLFVFVGDHGTNVLPVFTDVHLLYHHIPLLFYAPGLLATPPSPTPTPTPDSHPTSDIPHPTSLAPTVDHRTGSQMDILPSILGLLDLSVPHSAWGRSLFNDTFTDGGLAVFKQTGGGHAVAMAQGQTLLVLGSALGRPLFMTFNLGPDPAIHPLSDPALQARMERSLHAYVQSALQDLDDRTAGPTK